MWIILVLFYKLTAAKENYLSAEYSQLKILCSRLHRQKREQETAHPRAMLSFEIAEFANFMI